MNGLRLQYEAEGHTVHTNPETGALNYVSIENGGEQIAIINGESFSHIEIKKANVS